MQNELTSLELLGEPPPEDEMTIGDMARTYDVSLRTLRFYEDKGLLHPRREGTARFYHAGDRVRLQLILKGKRLGFSLAEIHNLIASRSSTAQAIPDAESNLIVTLGPEQIAAQINHLQRRRDELDGAIDELRRAHERMSIEDAEDRRYKERRTVDAMGKA